MMWNDKLISNKGAAVKFHFYSAIKEGYDYWKDEETFIKRKLKTELYFKQIKFVDEH